MLPIWNKARLAANTSTRRSRSIANGVPAFFVVAACFAERLVAALEDADSPLHAQLAGNVYFIVPVLNVTGFNASRREESSRSGGTMDPNRDYPDPCTTDQPFRLASTKRLAEFVAAEDIVAAVAL